MHQSSDARNPAEAANGAGCSRGKSAPRGRREAALVLTDGHGRVASWSAGAEQLFGLAAKDAIGQTVVELLVDPTPGRVERIGRAVAVHGRWEGECEVCLPGHESVAQEIYLVVERVEGGTSGFNGAVLTAFDDSERRRLLRAVESAEERDPVTGLWTRRVFLDRLSDAVDGRSHRDIAVLFFDLDQFRRLNEAIGRDAGDELLREVASRLAARARGGDVVARVGNDEFAVLCPEVASPEAAAEVSARLSAALSEPLLLGERVLRVTASIGVALAHDNTRSGDELLAEAESAAAAGKRNGAGQFVVATTGMLARASREAAIVEGLSQAVDGTGLHLLYQPVIDLATGAVIGAEALIRWSHPQLGEIGPHEFIPIAEESGQILAIGAWVIDEAVAQAARWQAARPNRAFRMAINLSARQLADPLLASLVRDALDRHGADPEGITFEITESAVMDDPDGAVATLRHLRAMGVSFAIDDFGTGFSSLSYLKRLPVDVLKIDRTFVTDMCHNSEDRLIVRAIIDLAAALGLQAVAEGVETLDHAEALVELGCPHGQGYLWSRPVEPEAFAAYVDVEHVVPDVPVARERRLRPDDAQVVLHQELINPLAVVRGVLDRVEGDGPSADVSLAQRSIARITAFLETMDELSALESGRLSLQRRRFDLGRVVTAEAEAAQAAAPDRVVTVDVDDDLVVDGDPDRVAVILRNLLSNADRFSPAGRPIMVRASAPTAGVVEVHVHDCGAGIPPADVADAFRKFCRLDRRTAGAGIGLYLARKLARAHGGDLLYRRGHGDGACFVLQLPRPPVADA